MRPVRDFGRLRHVPFLVALAGALAVRWTAVRGYPGVLWFTGDSYFYIGRAVALAPSLSKSSGYPLLLHLLEPWHSLTLVAVLQHLMGAAVGVMTYALLCRARLPAWAAALVSLPVLYDAYQIELEHLLMAEAVFTFLIAAGVTLLLWRPLGRGEAPPWWIALPAGLLIGYAVLVRSAGAPLVPVVFACLLFRRRGWRPALAFGAAAAVPIAAYATWFHSVYGEYGLTRSDGLFLWGRVAPFANCARIRPPAHEEGLCLGSELRYRNFAPGHLIWRSEAPPRQLFENVLDPQSNATLRDFAIRAIIAQPGDYWNTIMADLDKAFGTERLPLPTDATEKLYHFPAEPHTFPGGRGWGAPSSTVLSDAMRYEDGFEVSRVVPPYAGRMIAYQRDWYLPGPWLRIVFIVGAAGVLLRRGRRPEVLLVWAAGATLLLFPIASADFDYRYVVPAVPFACLAAGLAFSRRPAPAREEREDGDAGRGISRWSGIPGSLRRAKDPASAP
ncbi:phospholipid carrier-dependent glycosyltransferase [Actinomadura macrotermitis]|uniref:Phospholipid carrier-dependent glycosyltransferase n=1 Tax=Actinomadura macrotermitis TaxID=2585200 RepID=A0A7K0BP66_9ACTN|nr:phospholipid carrier-dependent glycosyltransferase [Actinomadura macrotermitis]MQY02961.1 hypothetical protein [Actinomadura macrotermitis]